jgi:methylglyoxal synthase
MKIVMNEKKKVAMIAHDNMKDEMLKWAAKNKKTLEKHELLATGTTGDLLEKKVGLKIEKLKSGPLGGDVQIGARISDGEVDVVIFFYDPLTAQPHDPDIKALMRVATLYDIPFAMNRSTADFIISSEYMNGEFVHDGIDFEKYNSRRREEFKNLNP